jgi:Listeria/Bacterioides repeat
MKQRFNKSGRASATFAFISVFLMISVSFTVIGFGLDHSSAAPGETVNYDSNGGQFEGGESTWSDQAIIGEEVGVNFHTIPTRAGYVFIGWALSSGGEAIYEATDVKAGRSFIMEGNVTLYAVWKAADKAAVPSDLTGSDKTCSASYSITLKYTPATASGTVFKISLNGGNTWSDYSPTTKYAHGKEILIEVIPDTSYSFVSWMGTTSGRYEILVISSILNDEVLTAGLTSAVLSINIKGSGSVTVSGAGSSDNTYDGPVDIPVRVGSIVTLTPSNGNFHSWTDHSGMVESTVLTIVMGSDKYATANFTVMSHVIVATAGPGGKIDPSRGVSVSNGDDLTFNFIPDQGYRVFKVVVDNIEIIGAESKGSYIFTDVQGDHRMEVYFIKNTYVITSTSDSNSTISLEGVTRIEYGHSMTFIFKANDGYEITDVIIDGVSHPEYASAGKYVFTNADANHSIHVVTDKRMTLNVNIVGNGNIEYSINGSQFLKYVGEVYFEKGSKIAVRGYADEGYEFSHWSGAVSGSDVEVEIDHVLQAITLTAHFEKNEDSSIFAFIMFLIGIFITILVSLPIIIMKSGYSVMKVASSSATIDGKNRARKNRPYTFMVNGISGTVSYIVGDGSPKTLLPDSNGQYIIPGNDVTGRLMISV